MKSVVVINTSPVKSLGLEHPTAVYVARNGIVEDRRFYLVDQRNRMITQRQVGRLVQVRAQYVADPEWLRLEFPDGTELAGSMDLGDPVTTVIWGRPVSGRLVLGDWSQALAAFCQHPVWLVRSDQPGQCFDEYPVSLLSQASVDGLGQRVSPAVGLDSRRFRPSFLLAGCQVHEEDDWLGGMIQIGEELVLSVVARDPRCVITTQNPDTGAADLDTLNLILSYRPSPRAPYFGVYGIVERPGWVSVGDLVQPLP